LGRQESLFSIISGTSGPEYVGFQVRRRDKTGGVEKIYQLETFRWLEENKDKIYVDGLPDATQIKEEDQRRGEQREKKILLSRAVGPGARGIGKGDMPLQSRIAGREKKGRGRRGEAEVNCRGLGGVPGRLRKGISGEEKRRT